MTSLRTAVPGRGTIVLDDGCGASGPAARVERESVGLHNPSFWRARTSVVRVKRSVPPSKVSVRRSRDRHQRMMPGRRPGLQADAQAKEIERIRTRSRIPMVTVRETGTLPNSLLSPPMGKVRVRRRWCAAALEAHLRNDGQAARPSVRRAKANTPSCSGERPSRVREAEEPVLPSLEPVPRNPLGHEPVQLGERAAVADRRVGAPFYRRRKPSIDVNTRPPSCYPSLRARESIRRRRSCRWVGCSEAQGQRT